MCSSVAAERTLLQPGCLGSGEGGVSQIRQGRSPPLAKGLLERGGRLAVIAGGCLRPSLGQEGVEAGCVEVARFDPYDVAG